MHSIEEIAIHDGFVESEVREKIPVVADLLDYILGEPGMTMSAAVTLFLMAVPPEHIAWYLLVLLRDRKEFGA